MAIKKSELYSSLWASCDELRGGMDASQYKDYVLFMLFIKYISDKYADTDDFAPPVTIREHYPFVPEHLVSRVYRASRYGMGLKRRHSDQELAKWPRRKRCDKRFFGLGTNA